MGGTPVYLPFAGEGKDDDDEHCELIGQEAL